MESGATWCSSHASVGQNAITEASQLCSQVAHHLGSAGRINRDIDGFLLNRKRRAGLVGPEESAQSDDPRQLATKFDVLAGLFMSTVFQQKKASTLYSGVEFNAFNSKSIPRHHHSLSLG